MGRNQQTPETPRGITIRTYASGKQSLVLHFQYRGVECRETLKNIEPTKGNIKYASNLKAEIENAISRGTFHYGKYFPNSKRAKLFGQAISEARIGDLLDAYVTLAEKTLKLSTVNDYKKSIESHLRPAFGKKLISDLSSADIREWVTSQACTLKRIRNIIIPLRHVIEQAIVDGLIEKNPLDNLILNKLVSRATATTNYQVDPFNEKEILKILNGTEGHGRALLQFAFYSGLRTNELIALEWRDIDFKAGLIHVRRGQVLGQVDTPKTQAGIRSVLMLPAAREALLALYEKGLKYHGRVFLNPKTMQPWLHDGQIRKTLWTPLLQEVGVRYRNPYQTRHTYASMLLSKGENPWWVATQMGHVDVEMIFKNYGRWIPDQKHRNGYQTLNSWTLPNSMSSHE
ncbi:DUF3596 domain-containing protein [Crenobacter sp. SG2303]|uniref:DUF3596 domain-containing protein n=1 Tax=Crenobacter oryzisoli TaxID=3056844 RepID=A0ABT7XPX9_9NEIS|nr:DUF3596 domain-containing protein [Crenobacter sp. SG2303]MDN0075624.1 DUF3596 domain-containing protein [Crenobacter sp. SG2303]